MKTAEEKQTALKTQDDYMALNAIYAALSTEGVYELYGGLNRENYLKAKKATLKKGIKISGDEKEAYIDIYVILKYGVKIPEVAWSIQKNVKKELEHIENLETKVINIHIKGVSLEEETGYEPH